MAAGSTEAFTNTSQPLPLPRFNTDLLNNGGVWSTEVMATASTDGFWEDDPEVVVKKKVNELKRKFHNGRQLQIKHLPRDVTEEEIRELLIDFPVQSVQLSGGPGSGMARVVLEDPEMLEDWDRERPFLLRGQKVPVQATSTEMMLCVARLPLTYTDAQFSALVRSYGEVRRCFLMISEKTGDSKGYGFVEYTSKESALQAKNMLDGKQVENWILCCDWLDSSHVTFDALHSKCLYVDRLPKDFRNMDEFRKVISSVVVPPYCQIALKNGCPQNWGLVEFNSSEDAENTQVELNGHLVRGQSIRMCYYIPGVRAINLYLKLLNDSGSKGKAAGLLPDPPAPAVFQQLQNLSKQNPAFAQSLQHIIWTQIQHLQNVGENAKKPTAGAPPASKGGVAPNHPPPNISPSPPPDTSQAALVILLAAQMQAQMGNNHPSLLGNPQMLAAVQNMIKQGPPPPPHPSNGHNANLVKMPQGHPMGPPPSYQYNPNVHNGMDARKQPHNINNNMKPAMYSSQLGQQKVPLLPNPKMTNLSPPPGEVAPSRPPYPSPDETHHATDAAAAAYWNGLLGQLQQNQHMQQQQNQHMPQLDPAFLEGGDRKSPLDKPAPMFAQPPPHMGKMPHPHPAAPGGGMAYYPDNMQGDLQQTINTLLSKAQNLNDLIGTLTCAIQTPGGNMPQQQRPMHANQVAFQFMPQGPGHALVHPGVVSDPTSLWSPPTSGTMSAPQQCTTSNPRFQPPGPPPPGHGSRSLMASPVPPLKQTVGFVDMNMKPSQFGWGPGHFLATPAPQYPTYSTSNVIPGLWSHPGSPVLVASPPVGLCTPIGQKRKYNRLLPSPEPSPEGNYIGQHSQGLGGHYADSYFKRKKKN